MFPIVMLLERSERNRRKEGKAFSVLVALLVAIGALAGCDTVEVPSAAAASLAPTAVPTFTEDECPFDLYEGEQITCGYLTVLEDRSQADGRTIELAVAIIHSTARRPKADPILYLEGGPGGSALSDPDTWLESLLREGRDIILFDQRGTGFSTPNLSCPETDAYFAGEETTYETTVEAATACHDRLVADGIDLTQYHSAASAADVEDLRRALEIEQWNLYGVSYGTRLVLTVMRDFPEAVRAVVLDSSYPPNVDGYNEDALNSIQAIERLLDGCSADADCDEAFPDLKERFYQVVADLNENPVEIDGIETTGDDLVVFLFDSLYDTEMIPSLPLVVYAASEGNYDPWSYLTSGDEEDGYRQRPPGTPDGADEPVVDPTTDAQGMFYSVECHEEVALNDLEEAADLVKDYPPQVTEGLLASTEEMFAVCDIWGAGEASTRESQAVRSTIPTLVFAGEYDPVTPPAWGKLAARTLSNSYYVEMPRGHAVSFVGDCGARVIRSFLNRPDREPNTSCVENTKYDFVLDEADLP